MEEFGPRFVDMSEPYNKKMIEVAENVAKDLGITAHPVSYTHLDVYKRQHVRNSVHDNIFTP